MTEKVLLETRSTVEVTRWRKRKLADLLPPPPFLPSHLLLWRNRSSPQLPSILSHFGEMLVSKKTTLLSCSCSEMLILPREGGAESKSRTWRTERTCSLLRAWSNECFELMDPASGYLFGGLGLN